MRLIINYNRTKYPDINSFFISLETKNQTEEEKHFNLLKKLEFELEERKKLCEIVEMLKKEKKELQKSNSQKQKYLDSLPIRINTIAKAIVPLQQQYLTFYTSFQDSNSFVMYLPSPLYNIYYQAEIFNHFQSSFILSISGNIQEAISYQLGIFLYIIISY